MAEHWKRTRGEEVRVRESSLRVTVKAIFEKMGVLNEDAAQAADVLVTADLWGWTDHGVSTLPIFVKGCQDGSINVRPNLRPLREFDSTATFDCDRGLGIVQASQAMRLAIGKAKRTGVGVVVMKNSQLLGACGYYAALPTNERMIGVCATIGGMLVPASDGESFHESSSSAVGAPVRNQAPFLFDTSASSFPMRSVAPRQGPVPESIAQGQMERAEQGDVPSLDFVTNGVSGAFIGHGSFAAMETLGALLSGAFPVVLIPSAGASHYLAAYSIQAFVDPTTYDENMDHLLRMSPGEDSVLGPEGAEYPGLLENEEQRQRRVRGIPLQRKVADLINKICGDLSVSPMEQL